MSLCVNESDKERLSRRLKRIEGQVRGIDAMIKNDRDCIEVLQQLTSVSGALKGVWLQITANHLRGCITEATQDHQNEKLIDELVAHLKKTI
jgi:CsoR family transcriptional regulator, copper-sensing transcriptional repressor